jgi:glutaredoxin
MPSRLLITLALYALALPIVQAQTLYKVVTPDGRVLYTDQPPAKGKVLKTLTPDAAPATALPPPAAEQLAKLQSLRAPTVASVSGVVLYSAVWCGYCTKAKAWLAGRGIAYREIDIDTPDGLTSFVQAGGGTGVPLLVANGQRVQGFSPGAYDQMFARK